MLSLIANHSEIHLFMYVQIFEPDGWLKKYETVYAEIIILIIVRIITRADYARSFR